MSRLQGSRLQRSRVAADRSNPAKPIRVGIVGANPARGWALAAHLPALVQLSGFTVTTASLTVLPVAGDQCRVIAWPGGRADRKLTAGSALLGPGKVLAAARTVWLTLPRPVPVLAAEGAS